MQNKSQTMDGNYKVGTLIDDNGKIGIIYREIMAGTWSENPLFNWRTNYEIYYSDGMISIMGKETIDKLVADGTIQVLEVPED
jgi:hypothetical protein